MTNFSRILFLITILIFNTIIIFPQWIQSNGPYGGKVFSFAINGKNIFAGTSGGVYLSTNNGLNWTPVNNELPASAGNVNALVINGNQIYAGIGGSGIYLSTNNGSSWSGINNGLPNTISALAIEGSTIFAGIYGNGVYISSNNGLNWTEVNNGLSNKYINSIAINGNYIFAGACLGNGPSGVFLSTDNGSNWSQVNNGLTDTLVSAITISGDNIFAGTASGTYRSTNNGTNWLRLNNGLPTNAYIRSLNFNKNNIFAGTDLNGIYISTDDGLNWSSENSGLPASNILTLAVNGNNILAGTNGNGIYISTDNGSTWNESSNGLTNTSIDAMVINGNNIFTAAGGEGIYLSSNDGSSWSHLKNGTPDAYIYSLALSGNNIFAGTRTSGVYMSTDNGTDWYGANNGLDLWNVENYISLASNGDNILAGTWEGNVYLSNNNNINWKCIGGFGTARSINALAMSGKNIFAAIGQGNGSGGVWRTTDYGTNWTELNSGLFSLNDVWDIAISGNNILARVTGNGPGEAGIFISSDNGTSWKRIIYNGIPLTGKGPFSVSGNKIFFGASYFSTDNGLTWNIFSTNGLPVSSVYAVAVSDNKVFAGTTGQGVWTYFQSEPLPVELTGFTAAVKQNSVVLNWKTATELNNYGFEVERTLYNNPSVTTKWESLGFIKGSGNSISTKEYSFTDITISGNGKFSYRIKQIDNVGKINYSKETEISVNFIPQVYSLENNFPNPFNPGTVIKYSLPYESNVKLTVYNTLGIKVRELISEVQQPGLHDYKFNAAGLSSGVYLYTIEASSIDGKENYNSTKKMILMK
jgi:photosystem II stability/assembly factor-like uncharacterized protein